MKWHDWSLIGIVSSCSQWQHITPTENKAIAMTAHKANEEECGSACWKSVNRMLQSKSELLLWRWSVQNMRSNIGAAASRPSRIPSAPDALWKNAESTWKQTTTQSEKHMAWKERKHKKDTQMKTHKEKAAHDWNPNRINTSGCRRKQHTLFI